MDSRRKTEPIGNDDRLPEKRPSQYEAAVDNEIKDCHNRKQKWLL
jgi:hypothetical protein